MTLRPLHLENAALNTVISNVGHKIYHMTLLTHLGLYIPTPWVPQ